MGNSADDYEYDEDCDDETSTTVAPTGCPIPNTTELCSEVCPQTSTVSLTTNYPSTFLSTTAASTTAATTTFRTTTLFTTTIDTTSSTWYPNGCTPEIVAAIDRITMCTNESQLDAIEICSCGMEAYYTLLANNWGCMTYELELQIGRFNYFCSHHVSCAGLTSSNEPLQRCQLREFYAKCSNKAKCRSSTQCIDFIAAHEDKLSARFGSRRLSRYLDQCTPGCLLGGGVIMNPNANTKLRRRRWRRPTILDYSSVNNDFTYIRQHRLFTSECSLVGELQLSNNVQAATPSFQLMNPDLMSGLVTIDLSHSRLKHCPDFRVFRDHPKRLRLLLNDNEIEDCETGIFCGMLDNIALIDISRNYFGRLGPIDVRRWFQCPDGGFRERRSVDSEGFGINFGGNGNLTDINGLDDLGNVSVNVSGTSLTDPASIPGNCEWHASLEIPYTTMVDVAIGENQRSVAVDGETYNFSCSSSVAYEIDPLPDCFNFDSVTATLTMSDCDEDDQDSIPFTANVIRHSTLDNGENDTEVCTVITFRTWAMSVEHQSAAILLTDLNYSRMSDGQLRQISFELTEAVQLSGACQPRYQLYYEDENCAINLTACADFADYIEVDETTGALVAVGLVPEEVDFPEFVSLDIYALDLCTGVELLASQVNLTSLSRVSATGTLSGTKPILGTVEPVAEIIELERGSSIASLHNVAIGIVVHGRQLSDRIIDFRVEGLPEGVIARVAGMESTPFYVSARLELFGTPVTNGIHQLGVFVDERHGSVPGSSLVDTAPVIFERSDKIVLEVIECVDFGSGCNFNGTCGRDTNRFDGIFTCVCVAKGVDEHCGKGSEEFNASESEGAELSTGAIIGMSMIPVVVIIALLAVVLAKKQNKAPHRVHPSMAAKVVASPVPSDLQSQRSAFMKLKMEPTRGSEDGTDHIVCIPDHRGGENDSGVMSPSSRPPSYTDY